MFRKPPNYRCLKHRPTPAGKPLLSVRLLRNLAAVVVPGVFVSWWLHAHTESFGPLVSLLGLGGVLAWAGFVLKTFVGEDQQKAIQTSAAGTFEGPWPERVALAGFAVFLAVSLCRGAVRVENVQGGDILVQVYEGQKPANDEFERLAAGGERNFPQSMWPWDSHKIRVKVSGLPAQEVHVRPWWRAHGPEKLQVPGSFLRPVVLIGAQTRLIVEADPKKHELTVTVNGKACPALPYDGRAVLVGADDTDLPLPAGLQGLEEWKTVLSKSTTANKLLPPSGGAGPPALRPGDTVAAVVTYKTDPSKVYAESGPIIVFQPTDRAAMVVPLLLTSPK